MLVKTEKISNIWLSFLLIFIGIGRKVWFRFKNLKTPGGTVRFVSRICVLYLYFFFCFFDKKKQQKMICFLEFVSIFDFFSFPCNHSHTFCVARDAKLRFASVYCSKKYVCCFWVKSSILTCISWIKSRKNMFLISCVRRKFSKWKGRLFEKIENFVDLFFRLTNLIFRALQKYYRKSILSKFSCTAGKF